MRAHAARDSRWPSALACRVAEEERFSPYACTLRPGFKLGAFAIAFFGVAGVSSIAIAGPRNVPLVLSGAFDLTARQAGLVWYVVGGICLAIAGLGIAGAIVQRRRPRQLRIERDCLVLREVASGREQAVRYADVTQAVRTVQSRIRLITVRHPAGVLNLPAAMFPSAEVFDQAARLIIERVKTTRASLPA